VKGSSETDSHQDENLTARSVHLCGRRRTKNNNYVRRTGQTEVKNRDLAQNKQSHGREASTGITADGHVGPRPEAKIETGELAEQT
jgi:hypothetical protein